MPIIKAIENFYDFVTNERFYLLILYLHLALIIRNVQFAKSKHKNSSSHKTLPG